MVMHFTYQLCTTCSCRRQSSFKAMAMNDTQTVKVATPQNPHAASKQIPATDIDRERIAVAAYHRAAARGFAAGHEVADWLCRGTRTCNGIANRGPARR
jgi:hypothetical protein